MTLARAVVVELLRRYVGESEEGVSRLEIHRLAYFAQAAGIPHEISSDEKQSEGERVLLGTRVRTRVGEMAGHRTSQHTGPTQHVPGIPALNSPKVQAIATQTDRPECHDGSDHWPESSADGNLNQVQRNVSKQHASDRECTEHERIKLQRDPVDLFKMDQISP